jgi:hypothetical protein
MRRKTQLIISSEDESEHKLFAIRKKMIPLASINKFHNEEGFFRVRKGNSTTSIPLFGCARESEQMRRECEC